MHIKTHPKPNRRPGILLMDSVLSLFVVGMMIVIYAGVINAREVSRRVSYRAIAAALADQEIDALKRMDITAVSNQTNGSFLGVLMNAGVWTIATDAVNLDGSSSPCPPATSGLHCGGKVLNLTGGSGFSGKVSGRLLFPAGGYSAATLQADWKVVSDSPSGWAIGYWFQSSDANNGYRLRWAATATDLDSVAVGNQNMILEKVSSGTATTLFSKANVAITTDTWNQLRVVLDPSGIATIKIYVNGTQQDTGNIIDTTFTNGAAALLGWGGVHAEADDVLTTTTATSRWNFEGQMVLPVAWTRLSLNTLPDTTNTTFDDNGLLTLTSYPNVNSASLKQAVLTIQWRQGEQTSSYTTTALIGRSGVGR